MNDNYWMKEAFVLAKQAETLAEIPVGAVIVYNNQLISSGYNQPRKSSDPTAHAEIIAIRDAAMQLNNYRLNDCTLYVTLEPCVMCAGALVHARIKRVVFACRDFKTGAAGSVFNYLQGFPLNHQVQIDEGIMEHECSLLLSDFFRKKNRG